MIMKILNWKRIWPLHITCSGISPGLWTLSNRLSTAEMRMFRAIRSSAWYIKPLIGQEMPRECIKQLWENIPKAACYIMITVSCCGIKASLWVPQSSGYVAFRPTRISRATITMPRDTITWPRTRCGGCYMVRYFWTLKATAEGRRKLSVCLWKDIKSCSRMPTFQKTRTIKTNL